MSSQQDAAGTRTCPPCTTDPLKFATTLVRLLVEEVDRSCKTPRTIPMTTTMASLRATLSKLLSENPVAGQLDADEMRTMLELALRALEMAATEKAEMKAHREAMEKEVDGMFARLDEDEHGGDDGEADVFVGQSPLRTGEDKGVRARNHDDEAGVMEDTDLSQTSGNGEEKLCEKQGRSLERQQGEQQHYPDHNRDGRAIDRSDWRVRMGVSQREIARANAKSSPSLSVHSETLDLGHGKTIVFDSIELGGRGGSTGQKVGTEPLSWIEESRRNQDPIVKYSDFQWMTKKREQRQPDTSGTHSRIESLTSSEAPKANVSRADESGYDWIEHPPNARRHDRLDIPARFDLWRREGRGNREDGGLAQELANVGRNMLDAILKPPNSPFRTI